MIIFEWDEKKEKSNVLKHGIGFAEAESVFYDPFSITIVDSDHSIEELRFVDIGMSDKNRVLVVSYTDRSDQIRIISVRKATQTERNDYDQQ